MKKIILLILAIVAAVSFNVRSGNSEESITSTSPAIIAYYFHGSFRCATCNKMESYAREAIDTNFKDLIDSGVLEFKAVNVEEKDNEHFVRDYQLYTKALVLSMIKDGKEVKAKNLDKIWELARNKQKFMEYVTSEINLFMQEGK